MLKYHSKFIQINKYIILKQYFQEKWLNFDNSVDDGVPFGKLEKDSKILKINNQPYL